MAIHDKGFDNVEDSEQCGGFSKAENAARSIAVGQQNSQYLAFLLRYFEPFASG
jgi:hypothetical protein